MLDTFCKEIMGTMKAPFNFEEELLNQAKVMQQATSEFDKIVSFDGL